MTVYTRRDGNDLIIESQSEKEAIDHYLHNYLSVPYCDDEMRRQAKLEKKLASLTTRIATYHSNPRISAYKKDEWKREAATLEKQIKKIDEYLAAAHEQARDRRQANFKIAITEYRGTSQNPETRIRLKDFKPS